MGTAFSIIHEKDLRTNYNKSGLSRVEIGAGLSPCMRVFKCILKAHCSWKPGLFSFGDKVQFFAFTTKTGYVTTEEKSWNITDFATFIPDFDHSSVSIYAGERDLEFYHYIGEMDEKYDIEAMSDYMLKLPYFCLFKDGNEYTEGHTGGVGSTVRTLSVIHHRMFGRYSLGWVTGHGGTHVGSHKHPELDQWYFILPGGTMTYSAGGESRHVTVGDVTYTKMNTEHCSSAEENEKYEYFWVETALAGY